MYQSKLYRFQSTPMQEARSANPHRPTAEHHLQLAPFTQIEEKTVIVRRYRDYFLRTFFAILRTDRSDETDAKSVPAKERAKKKNLQPPPTFRGRLVGSNSYNRPHLPYSRKSVCLVPLRPGGGFDCGMGWRVGPMQRNGWEENSYEYKWLLVKSLLCFQFFAQLWIECVIPVDWY